MNQALDLAGRFARQRTAHAADPMPAWATRARRLRALESLLLQHRAELAGAVDAG